MKSSFIKLSLIFVTLLLASTIQAQESYSFSLAEAQDYAVKNGYVSRVQAMEVEKSDHAVAEVIGQGFPQISATGDFSHYLDIPVQVIPDFISPVIAQNLVQYGVIDESQIPQGEEQFVPAQFGTTFSVAANVRAEQLIFNGSYFVGLQASKAVKQLSQDVYNKSEREVRQMVAEAYHTCLVSEQNLQLLEKSLETLNKTYKESQAQYDAGFIEELDVDQLRLNVLNLENQVENVRLYNDISRKMLKFQLGIPVSANIELTENLEALVLNASRNDLANRQAQLETHPDYLLAMDNRRIAELELKNEKVQYYPQLNAFFSYGQAAYRNDFNFFQDGDWFPTTVYGLNLRVPIFKGMSQHHRVAQGKIALSQREIESTQAKEQLELAVFQARANFENALRTFSNQTENVQLARRIRERTLIKYTEGVSGSTELNVAETQLLEAENAFANAQLDLLNSKIALDNALNNFQ